MPFQVAIIESERGWGTKIDQVLYFETAEEAWAFEKEFNKDNTELIAPDWYMQAQDPFYVKELPPGKSYHKPSEPKIEWPIK